MRVPHTHTSRTGWVGEKQRKQGGRDGNGEREGDGKVPRESSSRTFRRLTAIALSIPPTLARQHNTQPTHPYYFVLHLQQQ